MQQEKIRAKLDKLEAVTQMSNCCELEDYVTNHALPMILVDGNGHIIYWNKTMSRLVGKPLKEVKGKKPKDVFYEVPEDFDILFKTIKTVGHIIGSEVLLKTKYGPQKFNLYSNVHKDENDRMLNTRCVFVPIENGIL